MSFNAYMHVRNRYRSNPSDFQQLAEKHPSLKQFLIEKSKGGVTLDFCDPNAVRALTIAVAKEDFNLDLELSLGKTRFHSLRINLDCLVRIVDRLIPRIPQKLNYLHWIEDLIECRNDAIGIDIGR